MTTPEMDRTTANKRFHVNWSTRNNTPNPKAKNAEVVEMMVNLESAYKNTNTDASNDNHGGTDANE